MRPLAHYAMRGKKQAFFLATLFALIPFLGWLGSAIMGLVTLRHGTKAGFIILLGLTLADTLYFAFGSIGSTYLFYDSLTNNLPTFCAAIYLRRYASWNRLI